MKALLLDADGVVLKKEEYFSERFAREYDLAIDDVVEFFKGPLVRCQTGEADLKEELTPYLERWDWNKGIDEFLNYWFEDITINNSVEDFVSECRKKGLACYMASNNEHYRARKIEEVLGDMLDGYFFSADLKVRKENPEYFETTLERIALPALEVAFTDNEEKNVEAAKEVGISALLYQEGVLSQLLRDDLGNEFKGELR